MSAWVFLAGCVGFLIPWIGIPLLEHHLYGECWECRWHKRRRRERAWRETPGVGRYVGGGLTVWDIESDPGDECDCGFCR